MDDAVKRPWDLPDLLDAELPDLRLAPVGEVKLLDRRAREVAPAALGEDGRARLDVGPRLEVAQRLAVLPATLVAGAHADDRAVFDDELGGRGFCEHVGASLLGRIDLGALEATLDAYDASVGGIFSLDELPAFRDRPKARNSVSAYHVLDEPTDAVGPPQPLYHHRYPRQPAL